MSSGEPSSGLLGESSGTRSVRRSLRRSTTAAKVKRLHLEAGIPQRFAISRTRGPSSTRMPGALLGDQKPSVASKLSEASPG